ncbi:uncharacterized protein BO95DRAFT_462069 [Aspergillus brunneoviolaceus CBS 621.78]|uniref:Uncharacterized protein n=1 Tax=Aspergillus brunneoviolaceus CBS 621.78 TaxID=1450534 RepID=A0ACD1GE18_9EURO|nr:hypothetical protein BO95DRAFT_462069 [Aspergillus brunneoviolaceus CBS 621.78]RAH47359.1 hypothetical protein BO95DRAFT_462069 [Aspergillus brunneoviolaceus CBS 621.78]
MASGSLCILGFMPGSFGPDVGLLLFPDTSQPTLAMLGLYGDMGLVNPRRRLRSLPTSCQQRWQRWQQLRLLRSLLSLHWSLRTSD